ncbi:MAG TPA: response regulator [Candidatus Binatia bacterium]|nr:response regulator [Candidatus Binatia bacterium]
MRCPACAEDNPDESVFCGGCGTNLSAAVTCASCGRSDTPGIRFCRGCGAAMTAEAPDNAKLNAIEQRLDRFEHDVADLALEVASLVALKEQLQEALDGLRKRAHQTSEPSRTKGPSSVMTSRTAVVPSLEASHAGVPISNTPIVAPAGDRITILHLDDHGGYQESLRNLVEKFGHARYCLAREPFERDAIGRRLLALNLLAGSVDALATVAEAAAWGIECPAAFTYCGDGARGFALGMVEFFPPPFEPNLCVTRLLERPSPAQKLLVVSDAVDATSELRSILARLGCATSVAFDGKQALNLLPMVRPDVILLDLNLPKGDAWRVIGRVRADPANVTVNFALMWQHPIVPAELRQQVARVAKDLPFAPDDLRRAIGREFGPGGAAYVTAASKAA